MKTHIQKYTNFKITSLSCYRQHWIQ